MTTRREFLGAGAAIKPAELGFSTPMFYNPPYSICADSKAAQEVGLAIVSPA